MLEVIAKSENKNISILVIICMFSSTRELSKEFMSAIHTLGYNTHEFVYILPWLQAESKDMSPWIGTDGKIMQDVKDVYANSIIVNNFMFKNLNSTSALHASCYNKTLIGIA
jgi:hypothetical protein